MVLLKDILKDLKLKDPLIHENMGIRPVTGTPGKRLDFSVCNEKLESDQPRPDSVYVGEVGGNGEFQDPDSVGECADQYSIGVANQTQRVILIPQGRLYIGGGQNRQVMESVLLEPGFRGSVPTKCQEQGRSHGGRSSFTSGGLASTSSRYIDDQHTSWRATSESLDLTRTMSRTSDGSMLLRLRGIEEYMDFFMPELEKIDDLTGMLVAFPANGQFFIGADIANNPDAMRALLNDALRSYAAHAAERRFVMSGDGTYDKALAMVTPDDIAMQTQEFYAAMQAADYLEEPSLAGVGTRTSSRSGTTTRALVHDDGLVHLCATNQAAPEIGYRRTRAHNPTRMIDAGELTRYSMELELPRGRTVIGRSNGDERSPNESFMQGYVLISADDVSRNHAVLLNSGDSVSIEDLGSKNGTYVEGQKIEGKNHLKEGDMIKLSEFELKYSQEGDKQKLLYRPIDAPQVQFRKI